MRHVSASGDKRTLLLIYILEVNWRARQISFTDQKYTQ